MTNEKRIEELEAQLEDAVKFARTATDVNCHLTNAIVILDKAVNLIAMGDQEMVKYFIAMAKEVVAKESAQ